MDFCLQLHKLKYILSLCPLHNQQPDVRETTTIMRSNTKHSGNIDPLINPHSIPCLKEYRKCLDLSRNKTMGLETYIEC